MRTSAYHTRLCTNDGTTYLALFNNSINDSALDLIEKQPIDVNIQCMDGTIIFGQIEKIDYTGKSLSVHSIIDDRIVDLPFTAVRYLHLSLPILPPGQNSREASKNKNFRIVFSDNKELTGVARSIYKDDDGIHIWKRNFDQHVKHMFIPYQSVKQEYISPM